MTGFEELAEAVGADLEAKIADLTSAATEKQIMRQIHRSWVVFVQSSARERMPAKPSQIVTEGNEIGWRIWGKEEKSRARMELRVVPFRDVVRKIVDVEIGSVLKAQRQRRS